MKLQQTFFITTACVLQILLIAADCLPVPISDAQLINQHMLKNKQVYATLSNLFIRYRDALIKKRGLPNKNSIQETYLVNPDFEVLHTLGFKKMGEGSSPVFEHNKLPGSIIKFDAAVERLKGLKLLKEVIRKRKPSIPIELPSKNIVPIQLNKQLHYIILEKKLALVPNNIQALKHSPLRPLAEVKQVLQDAGYCDAHPGNIKKTKKGFAIIDTDIRNYSRPGDACGVRELELKLAQA